MKGAPLIKERYIRKGYFFCQKWKRKGWGGLGIGAELPRIKLCWVPPRRSCFFFVHKLTLKPLSTVKDHTASLTGKAVREKTLLSFLQKLAIIGWGREWSEELLRSRRMLFAEVYYLYTCRSDDIKKNCSNRVETYKEENKRTTPGKNIYTLLSTFTRFSSFIWCKFYFHNCKLVSPHKYLIILKLHWVPFSLVVVRISNCISL